METLKKYNREEEEDKLFSFLLLMADEQNKFFRVGNALGYRFTNPQSVESLEELERYVKVEKVDFKDQSDQALLARTNVWFYLGQALCNDFGGDWEFSMDDENTENWGAYVIKGHAEEGLEFEPQDIVRNFIGNGYPTGAFRRAILADVEEISEDFLADLPTETDPNDPVA